MSAIGRDGPPDAPASEGCSDGWLEPPQPQDLVITLLADNVRKRREDVWSGGLVDLLAELGFSTGASRVALARLARRGLISRLKSGRRVAYQITPRTERILREGDRRIFMLGKEDVDPNTATLLWHSLKEDQRLERGHLARRLRFLGFGSLQDATWVAPGDREELVSDLIEELGIADSCSLLIGRGSRLLGLDHLIDRAWDLPALAERYESYLARFGHFRGAESRGRLSDQEAFLVRTQAIHNFRQFPSLDPGLPPDAYPDPDTRQESISLFHAIYDGLETAAHRHFDKMTED